MLRECKYNKVGCFYENFVVLFFIIPFVKYINLNRSMARMNATFLLYKFFNGKKIPFWVCIFFDNILLFFFDTNG